jgi:hypothetical protein
MRLPGTVGRGCVGRPSHSPGSMAGSRDLELGLRAVAALRGLVEGLEALQVARSSLSPARQAPEHHSSASSSDGSSSSSTRRPSPAARMSPRSLAPGFSPRRRGPDRHQPQPDGPATAGHRPRQSRPQRGQAPGRSGGTYPGPAAHRRARGTRPRLGTRLQPSTPGMSFTRNVLLLGRRGVVVEGAHVVADRADASTCSRGCEGHK